MNKTACTKLLCAFFSIFAGYAHAATLPQSAAAALEQRDAHLSHITFIWKRTADEHHIALPAAQITAIVTKTQQGLEADYRQHGITDPALLQKYLQKAGQGIMESLGESFTHSTATWRFTRDGDATLASGIRQTPSKMQFALRQFYMGNTALTVLDTNRSLAGDTLPTIDPAVWKTTGNSIDYDSPVMGLNLLPEHFAMLMGANPLALHGAQWQLSSETAAAWVLTTHIGEQGVPTTVELTLGKSHNGVPEVIKIHQGKVVYAFQANSFRLYQNEWIADKVEFARTVPGIVTESQVWELQAVQPSQPVRIMEIAHSIHDYRLLGANLTVSAVQHYEVQGNHNIVFYKWSGQIPTEEDLRRLQNQQHPGESSPDPKQTSSLPFVGGLMMLVGGVWMFRRRGGSS